MVAKEKEEKGGFEILRGNVGMKEKLTSPLWVHKTLGQMTKSPSISVKISTLYRRPLHPKPRKNLPR